MKKISIFLLLFFLTKTAEAKITILACEPEWQALAKEIVADKAEVFSVTLANQNPANVSLLDGIANSFRKADMVFCSGNDLEKKWLNRAINSGDNFQVISNKDNLLLAADYVERKPQIRNGVAPRVHLNPHNLFPIATEFTRRVKLIDPINSNFYEKSHANFVKKLTESIEVWEKSATNLQGMKVVINDDSWLELTKWLKLEVVAAIDSPKSYVANNKRMNDLLALMKKTPAQAIIFANYEDKKSLLWLSEKAKIRVILLPFTIGGAANSGDLFSMFTTTINSLSTDCLKVVCQQISIFTTQ